MTSQTVLVVGSWHLGSVVGACLAEAGNTVTYWDQSKAVADKWSKGIAPIFEPGLDEIIKAQWKKRLSWCENFQGDCKKSDWIVIAYDTPIDEQDEVILTSVLEGFSAVVSNGVKENSNFFLTSQLPVGTCKKLKAELKKKNPHWRGQMLYQPENLRLGEALQSFRQPDRMVLGIDGTENYEMAEKIFRELTQNFQTPINCMSMESAEMLKHALNSFLATCVVYANELSELCEKSGANAWDIVKSLKQDSRVGPKAFLRPGLGFAGGTLARDVKILSHLSAKATENNFFARLFEINTARNQWVVEQLELQLEDLKQKKILILGATYKPNTSTMRRSPTIEIGNLLRKKGAECIAMDPMADLSELSSEEKEKLPFALKQISTATFSGVDAAVLVTEWKDFQGLDWTSIAKQMNRPLIIDTKNFLALPQEFSTIIPGRSNYESK